MKIIHISAECYPIAKVGGLADVVGALPKYQNRIGNNATVIMPYCATAYVKKATTRIDFCHNLGIAGNTHFAEVLSVDDPSLGYPLFLVRIEGLTDRERVYGYADDPYRFVAFQRVVLQWILSKDTLPEIIHCHDHHSGLIPFMLRCCEDFSTLKYIPTILSIHNAQYQGQFFHDMGWVLPRFRESDLGLLDWDGMINPLAAAIKCAWRVNTVSPSYMEELKHEANGLEFLLSYESWKCQGILNGIDAETWNPATDTYLHKNYTTRTRQSGRKVNKEALCEEFGLDASKPLFGFIGRLVGDKGADLLPDIIHTSLHYYDINIIILGSGSPDIESQLHDLSSRYEGRYNSYIGYKESISHQIYAGADFLLMPSRVEPCGLNQMYSLRYGCMPIVRRTGGLKDTVIDLGEKGGFGICHDNASVEDVVYSIGRAVNYFKDQKTFKEVQKTMMQIEHSWENSAQMYVSLYKNLK